MVNNNQTWTIVGVSLVVALVTSIVTGMVMNANVQTSPPPAAASCDRDATCEVNSLNSAGTVTADTLKSSVDLTLNSGKIILSPEEGGVSITENSNQESVLYVNTLKPYSQDDNGNLLLEIGSSSGTIYTYGPLKAQDDVQIVGMINSQDSSSYVCVNKDGTLFRSDTAC